MKDGKYRRCYDCHFGHYYINTKRVACDSCSGSGWMFEESD